MLYCQCYFSTKILGSGAIAFELNELQDSTASICPP